MAERLDLAVQSIACRPGFVADVQLRVTVCQLAENLLHRQRQAVDLAEVPNLAIAAAIGDGDGVLLLRCVEPDKCFAILLHGPPSVHEARLGPPEQPSYSLLHDRADHRSVSGRT